MKLWQEILSDYGDACYFMSFSELADEYGTTEMAVGKAIGAIIRRSAMCGTVEYADGSEIKLSLTAKRSRSKKKRKRSHGCGCHSS